MGEPKYSGLGCVVQWPEPYSSLGRGVRYNVGSSIQGEKRALYRGHGTGAVAVEVSVCAGDGDSSEQAVLVVAREGWATSIQK